VFVLARGLYGPKVGLVAAFLWAAAAWVLFMSATYMNHVGATTLALGAWAVLWGPRRIGTLHLAAAGLLLAATAATRPLDGVAATLPVAVWLIANRQRTAAGWLFVGMVPAMLGWGYLNWRLVGSPLTLGYTAHYGSEVGLGFHTDPWGRPYTPFIALGNLTAALRRLHIYFYEWPIPALLPLALWALIGKQWSWKDLVVAVGVIAGPLLYLFYWHSGFYPGPRFYYIAAPFIVIAFARGCVALWRWARGRSRSRFRVDVALVAAAALVLIWGWVGLLPRRWEAYRDQLPSMKLHPERELAAADVDRAVVIVAESWGSRIIARLWGLGAPPGLVERVYHRADACDLHRFTARARAAGLAGAALVDSLSQFLEPVSPAPQTRPAWPDPSLRLRPGVIPAQCLVEMRRDLEGFTLYGSLAWRNAVGLETGIVFARDIPEFNGMLLARYQSWPVWRYAPPPDDPESLPVLRQLERLNDPASQAGSPP
jgi:hypothetical protein